jgi:phage/plasmid primase-like uncharacterized protein
VAREKGIDDLRDDGIFVAVDAAKKRFALFDGAEEIAANFVLDGDGRARVEIRNAAQFAESPWLGQSRFRRNRSACGHSGPILRGLMPAHKL